MSNPTKRTLLADAERIIRGVVDNTDLYYLDDARDWLRSLEQLRKSPLKGRKVRRHED